MSVEYAGVKQQWLVIRSQAAKDAVLNVVKERAKVTAERQLLKLSEEEGKRFDALTRQEFSCEADALQALECYRESCLEPA